MSDNFYFQQSKGITLIKAKNLALHKEITHAFSTRLGGVSTGECSTLNLSWKRRDSEENVKENHRRLAKAMGIDVNNFCFIELVHGDKVYTATQADRHEGKWWENWVSGYDAIITNQPQVALMARTADCATILLYDPVKKAIGAVHSGWRGTVLQVAKKAVQAMADTYGCNPADIIAAMGPCICPDCFLVHEDVANEFLNNFGANTYEKLMPDGRYSIDMQRCIYDSLLKAGLKKENISRMDSCTAENDDLFFSHRREKGATGIMLAVIQLN